MIVPVLAGALSAMGAAVLRLLRGRPSSSEELEAFALALILAFIDGFMLAYLAPFYQAFAAKLTFHLFVYMLLASLTAVLYAAYRAATDLRVYAVATTPWFYILVLILVSQILRSTVIFIA
jgi:hypothetical protein